MSDGPHVSGEDVEELSTSESELRRAAVGSAALRVRLGPGAHVSGLGCHSNTTAGAGRGDAGKSAGPLQRGKPQDLRETAGAFGTLLL